VAAFSNKTNSAIANAERLAELGIAAASLVENDMTLGLGSGSTAEAFLRALGERVLDGLKISGVPTSSRTEKLARSLDMPIVSLESRPTVDLGFDGANEIDPRLDVVKGRGGALLFEKIVALECARWIVIAAAEKRVDQLGLRFGVPVEIVPFGWRQTLDRFAGLGVVPDLRSEADGTAFMTDGGNLVADCRTGLIGNTLELAQAIKALPGVIDHGIFVQMADAVMISELDGSVQTQQR